VWSSYPPQAPLGLAGFPLELPELLQIRKRESGVRVPVPLLDDLGVHEGAIGEVDIGEGPTVLILALLVILEMDGFPLRETLCKGCGLLAEILDGLAGILRLRRVYSNHSHLLPCVQLQGIPIDHLLDENRLALRRRCRCGVRGCLNSRSWLPLKATRYPNIGHSAPYRRTRKCCGPRHSYGAGDKDPAGPHCWRYRDPGRSAST
jgi:hypothetical protein